ncbi:vWA domain-containing protein [Spirulina sp. 06S082]|uniref:vWA domain-containing protein n=1 Tax=Spirulina sp. 06S082 TaxID=3110248 RepID=UPI002B214215|nr:vWA domain-containing protein [Spirulina sp. 06S082]MEA5468417.1 vWA domain-containing protein [Spirulina sp. 06S082]
MLGIDSVSAYRRPFHLYPLFQIPLMFLGLFLVLAALFWLLGLGRPPVAVAIALDLSNSTYGDRFNAPGSVLESEIQAVNAYLDRNTPELLRQPNQVKVLGFAGVVRPLTEEFANNSEEVKEDLENALRRPGLEKSVIPGSTDLSRAINAGTDALSSREECRELLLVTDGQGDVSPTAIADATLNRVKLNSIVIGADAPALALAAVGTGGKYVSGNVNDLEQLFSNRFFGRFNSNLKWLIFWLACAWVALMWTLVLPFDRIILQGWRQMPMDMAGKIALGNAYFWTGLTPIIVWRIYKMLDLALPFLSQC